MNNKVLIRGPLLTNSGYGIHSRQVFKWLLSRKNIEIFCQILPWGSNPWILDRSHDNNVISEILSRSIEAKNIPITKFNESYQIQLPNEWIKISDHDVGITAGAEYNICNRNIIDDINKMDQVIVSSTFTKNTFINTSKMFNKELKTDIIVIPESFPDEFLKDTNNKTLIYNRITTDFNFLIFGQISSKDPSNDRKNTLKTLKCLLTTFYNRKDIGIVIKVNTGNNSKINKLLCKKLIKEFLEENDLNKNRKCKIYLVHGNLTDDEVKGLYSTSNVLISGSRGEGYGLTHLEASFFGLPILSTGWSGYTDFLKNNYTPIKYKLENVKIKSNLVESGISKWAEFDFEDMKERLSDIYKNYRLYKSKSDEHKIYIKQNYNMQSIIKHYNDSVRV